MKKPYRRPHHTIKKRSPRTLNVYKSYSFRTKDPVIDELRTMVEDQGAKYAELHEQSGVSTTCLYGWFRGKTMRPQSATVEAVGRALGFRRTWVAMKTKDDGK